MKTIIHVNQHKIRANTKNGTDDPVLTIKTYKTNEYASEAIINGPCKIKYSPHKPLSCGARVWIETDSDVIPQQAATASNELELPGVCNKKPKRNKRLKIRKKPKKK